ncbi:MAG: Acyl carrier protein phosphodiesterase-like protein [uncultured bacterium]|nr:MAG: Acyl carrier protein phosphodiesterase-like protein [uncultured bacterium]
MKTLLYIETSPLKERSYSTMIATNFIETYKKEHPNDRVETIDLWSYFIPEFNGDTIKAKYRILHGQKHTPSESKAWRKIVDIFEVFNSADKYLISIPMWNFGIPYKLKHYIDVITQPGLAFSYSPEEGYKGLVSNKPITVIYARGGEYSSNSQMQKMDVQKPYIETWLKFIGFTDIKSIIIEPTLSNTENVEKAKAVAEIEVLKIARNF